MGRFDNLEKRSNVFVFCNHYFVEGLKARLVWITSNKVHLHVHVPSTVLF